MDIGWVVRMVLTIAGGALASKGYVGTDEVEVIAGAGSAVAGVVWSAVERRKLLAR